MARNRLTWRDVAAPDYGSAIRGAEAANRMFQDALGGLSTSLGSFATQRQAQQNKELLDRQLAAEDAFSRQLAAASGDTEATQALLRTLGSNPDVRGEFIERQIGTNRNTWLTGDTTAEDLAQTILDNQRTNRDNRFMDEFRPIAGNVAGFVSSGGNNPFEAMSEEQRASFNRLPAEEQTRLLSEWSGEQTSNLSRDSTRQNMGQSATRFNNELVDRNIDQAVKQLVYGARQSGLDSADQAAYIGANAPNALIAAEAMSKLPSATTATGETPEGGGFSSGGRGGAGSGGSTGFVSGSLPTDEARERALTGLDLQSRINQEENIFRTDELTRLENDKTPDYAIADQLIAEDGAFPGANRGHVVREIQKIMQEQNVSAAQAGSILTRNTRPKTAWDTFVDFLPISMAYRATLGEFPVSGGGLRLNEEGVKASSGMVGSGAYQQQREAQAERTDVLRLLDGLAQQREAAQVRAEQALRQERATNGAYDPTEALDAVSAIDMQIENALRGIEGEDARLGRLVRDPDNPGQFTTTGELRKRGLERQAEKEKKAAKR